MYVAYKWSSDVSSRQRSHFLMKMRRKMDISKKNEQRTEQETTWIAHTKKNDGKNSFIHHSCLSFKSTLRANSRLGKRASARAQKKKLGAKEMYISWIMRHMKWKVLYNKRSPRQPNENRMAQQKKTTIRTKKRTRRRRKKINSKHRCLPRCPLALDFILYRCNIFFSVPAIFNFWATQLDHFVFLPFSRWCYNLYLKTWNSSIAGANATSLWLQQKLFICVLSWWYQMTHTVGFDTDYQVSLNAARRINSGNIMDRAQLIPFAAATPKNAWNAECYWDYHHVSIIRMLIGSFVCSFVSFSIFALIFGLFIGHAVCMHSMRSHRV